MIDPETIIDGRYRVISRLGSGGMADVYLAEDQLLGRQVAVKVLHHHFAEDHEFVERFRREASSAAALSHPNIVGIFDRGEWNGTYYIAMEYVAGRSLKQIVREDGALEPARAIDIVVQILRAARFAHRRGVIHRDLKPHNVILDEEGRARVTDFGIARAGASDMTLTGSIMGTAQYLSPEQAQGFAVSDASDLYSVGVILYELLTGVVPFEGDSAVAIAFKQVSAAPRPPSELNPALPTSLDAVVMRALAKDPAGRYPDADALITALQREREREREALPSYTGVAGGGGVETRPTVAVAPPTVASPLLVAPPAYAVERVAEDDGGPRGRTPFWVGLAVLLALAAIAAVLLLKGSTATVKVPPVAGMTEQGARTTLQHHGLEALFSEHPSTRVETGRVLSEKPVAGASVKKGSRVAVVISSGPEIKGLLEVAGETYGQAAGKLSKAGFRPVEKKQPSSTVAAGKVIGTEPPAGTAEVQGNPVTVLVSSGPAPVSVPNLTGDSLAAAEEALSTAGLALGTVRKKTSSNATAGTVLSQTPASGNSVHAGTKVDLTVAQAPTVNRVPVPTVVGDTEVAAEAALERVGFVPQLSSVISEASQQGRVLRQSPGGGTHANRGANVIIYVGVAGSSTGPSGATTPTTTSPATPPTSGTP